MTETDQNTTGQRAIPRKNATSTGRASFTRPSAHSHHDNGNVDNVRQGNVVLVDDVPLLQTKLLRSRASLRRNELLQVCNGVVGVALDPNFLAWRQCDRSAEKREGSGAPWKNKAERAGGATHVRGVGQTARMGGARDRVMRRAEKIKASGEAAQTSSLPQEQCRRPPPHGGHGAQDKDAHVPSRSSQTISIILVGGTALLPVAAKPKNQQ